MKIFFPFFILILSSSAFAGINVVGKGGGFAEMLALKMDRELSRQLSSCLSRPHLCEISNEGKAFAEELIQILPVLQRVSLQFASECRNEITANATSVEIPSCLLYTENPDKAPSPRPVKEISVLVLAARGAQAGLRDPLMAESLKPAFEDFKLFEDIHVIPFGDKRVILHSTLLEKNWYEKERSLILEVPAESQDITDLLTHQLCGTEKLEEFEVKFDRKQLLDHQRVLFMGEIIWKCRMPPNHRFKGKISVTGQMNSELALVPKSPQVLIRQKENVW